MIQNKTYRFLVFCVVLLVVAGCSRKKNTFVSRNMFALTAKYNVLFHGNEALDREVEQLFSTYNENYWDILPIEPLAVDEDAIKVGESENSNFSRAEEKAIKAVQKHSVNVKGKEYNSQMDDAYMLLGKSRYYDQRFVPALEAFNYILAKYPASDKINMALIWRAKTNIRLDNDAQAVKNLKRLLTGERLEDEERAEGEAALAQAYINLNHLDSAQVALHEASKVVKQNNRKARYWYIKGQLYEQNNQSDSAYFYFDQVVQMNRKIPRGIWVQAQLLRYSNSNPRVEDSLMSSEFFRKLLENRENRPYLGNIYHVWANIKLKQGLSDQAKSLYKESLKIPSSDAVLMAKNYEAIGNISFDQTLFREAGAYYDSTLTALVKDSKAFRTVRRKRDNLEDVIFYENQLAQNDSIIRLSSMSKNDQRTFVESFVEDLKLQDEKSKAAGEKLREVNVSSGALSTTSKFYFYNANTVAYGKSAFESLWGEIKLEDNWRWTPAKSAPQGEVVELKEDKEEDNGRYAVETYLSQIPTEAAIIDNLILDRNKALYQLGLLYKDRFKAFSIAQSRLETLLNLIDPTDNLTLPATYHLFRLYEESNQTNQAEEIKSKLIKNYPESRFVALILNPKTALTQAENSPQLTYNSIYQSYETGELEQVIEQCNKAIFDFDGDPLIPRFEMLGLTAGARLFGLAYYKNGLTELSVNYPNSAEGKRATELLKTVIPDLENQDFEDQKSATEFKVIFTFPRSDQQEIVTFAEKLNSALSDVKYFNLSTSVELYNQNTTFVLVNGLKSIQGAEGFAEILKDSEVKIDREFFPISSQNYQIVQVHKNLEKYLEQH